MADTIRFGKVSNIDYETGCMEITDACRRWLEGRAGGRGDLPVHL